MMRIYHFHPMCTLAKSCTFCPTCKSLRDVQGGEERKVGVVGVWVMVCWAGSAQGVAVAIEQVEQVGGGWDVGCHAQGPLSTLFPDL